MGKHSRSRSQKRTREHSREHSHEDGYDSYKENQGYRTPRSKRSRMYSRENEYAPYRESFPEHSRLSERQSTSLEGKLDKLLGILTQVEANCGRQEIPDEETNLTRDPNLLPATVVLESLDVEEIEDLPVGTTENSDHGTNIFSFYLTICHDYEPLPRVWSCPANIQCSRGCP